MKPTIASTEEVQSWLQEVEKAHPAPDNSFPDVMYIYDDGTVSRVHEDSTIAAPWPCSDRRPWQRSGNSNEYDPQAVPPEWLRSSVATCARHTWLFVRVQGRSGSELLDLRHESAAARGESLAG